MEAGVPNKRLTVGVINLPVREDAANPAVPGALHHREASRLTFKMPARDGIDPSRAIQQDHGLENQCGSLVRTREAGLMLRRSPIRIARGLQRTPFDLPPAYQERSLAQQHRLGVLSPTALTHRRRVLGKRYPPP